jgi:hypothetical protein
MEKKVSERGFKKKTIVYNIQHKIAAWLKSLDNEELSKEIDDHYIVTGGAIASMLMGAFPNDYDVYFDNVDTAAKVAEHYIKTLKTSDKVSKIEVRKKDNRIQIYIKSAGIASEGDDFNEYQYFEGESVATLLRYFKPKIVKEEGETKDKEDKETSKRYTALSINTNAITLSNDVQLIVRFIGNPEEIHRSFDFIHATNYYTKKGGLVLNPAALEATLTKELKYVGSLYPICSMFRTKKFIERGWTITAGEMLKIAYDINKLDLDNPAVLEDQLVGVDAAYFHQILAALKQENKPIERTYLFELINRVFDNSELIHDDIE